jgi:O-antigen/teichoic acid export membrane protein
MFDKIKQFIGHVLIYGFGNIGNRMVGFLLIPVYSRYLSPADYGVLALVGMFDQILYAVMNMGQSSALFRTYFAHDDPKGHETVVTTSLWLIVCLSMPIGLLGLVLAKPLAVIVTGNADYASWLALGVAAVVAKVLLRLPLQVLRARQASRQYAGWMLAQTLAGFVLAIIFVVGVHWGGWGVLLSQLLGQVLVVAYLLPATVKGLAPRFSRHDAKDLLTYGLAVMPTAIFSFLIHLSDRYFLKYYTSVSVVGIYALGYRFGEVLYFVILAFELAYPQFVFGHLKTRGAPALYARVCTYFFVIMGFAWLAVSLPAEEIVRVMAHPAYYEAHRVIPWIAGAFFFQGVGWVWNIGMHVHKIVKVRLIVSVTTMVLILGLNFWLIPRYGMMGAAAAALLSFMLQAVIQVVVGHRYYPVPFEFGRVTKVAVVILGTYFVGNHITWGSIPMALAGKAILILCAPLLLYLAGFFEPGEMDRVKALIQGFRRDSAGALQLPEKGK